MKFIKKGFFIIICSIIALSILNFNHEVNSASMIDNRNLSESPKMSDENYTKSWESYINDRIGFRDRHITYNTMLNDVLFHEMIHPTYEYGKDNYIFPKLGNPNQDYAYLDTFISMLKRIQDYCEQREIPFLFVIEPRKDTIYEEYLPEGYDFKNFRLNYVYEKLDENQINYVDNVSLLKEKAKTKQVFNIKYDAGHWNDIGAYYGVNNILLKLNETFPDLHANELEMFDIGTKVETTLPVSKFEINEVVPKYTLKKEISDNFVSMVDGFGALKINKDYNNFYYNVNLGSENNVNGLYFQGSYLNSRVHMLWPSVKESMNVHAYQNIIDVDYYVNVFQPDFIVFETAEYAISNAYYNQENINKKEYNPLFDLSNCVLVEVDIDIDEKDDITHVEVPMKKGKYAYFIIGESVYDLLWDENKNLYYVDIATSEFTDSYEIYISKESANENT